MSYKVLYRKYRPNDFDNVVGQEYTVDMLKKAIITGKNAHAYIFTGPRGTGKTSSAKIFAKALNCEHPVNGNPCNKCKSCLSFKESPDIIEIDAASNNGVEEIRELINNVKLVPSNSKYKVYIIDEVHMLTTSAFNALLLTLEEPPSHVVFILATTDIQDVPITILSRCQRFDFKPVNKTAIINRLKMVCSEESIKITDDALEEIALISAGGMRDALGMLDQLASDDAEITLDMVSNYFGSVSVKKIDELLTSIENNNAEKLVEILGNIRDSGTNYTVFIEKLILELRKCAIEIKTGKVRHDFGFNQVYNMIVDLNECLCNININIDPYVLIEIVLLKYINTGNVLGNNLGNNLNVGQDDTLVSTKISTSDVQKSTKKTVNKNISQTVDNLGNAVSPSVEALGKQKEVKKVESKKEAVIHRAKIDIDVRINNTFVEASKDDKAALIDSWPDFMSYLMNSNRNLASLVADTTVLAASKKYALIQNKIDNTNDLINNSIGELESAYKEFSNNDVKFAALNSDLWKKTADKCRYNLKNKIQYKYMEENISYEDDVTIEPVGPKDDIIDVGKDVFGTFEVE